MRAIGPGIGAPSMQNSSNSCVECAGPSMLEPRGGGAALLAEG